MAQVRWHRIGTGWSWPALVPSVVPISAQRSATSVFDVEALRGSDPCPETEITGGVRQMESLLRSFQLADSDNRDGDSRNSKRWRYEIDIFTRSALGGVRSYRQEVILSSARPKPLLSLVRTQGSEVSTFTIWSTLRIRRSIPRSSGFVANYHSVQYAWVDRSLGHPWSRGDRGHI